jgi:hypothetical protein
VKLTPDRVFLIAAMVAFAASAFGGGVLNRVDMWQWQELGFAFVVVSWLVKG